METDFNDRSEEARLSGSYERATIFEEKVMRRPGRERGKGRRSFEAYSERAPRGGRRRGKTKGPRPVHFHETKKLLANRRRRRMTQTPSLLVHMAADFGDGVSELYMNKTRLTRSESLNRLGLESLDWNSPSDVSDVSDADDTSDVDDGNDAKEEENEEEDNQDNAVDNQDRRLGHSGRNSFRESYEECRVNDEDAQLLFDLEEVEEADVVGAWGRAPQPPSVDPFLHREDSEETDSMQVSSSPTWHTAPRAPEEGMRLLDISGQALRQVPDLSSHPSLTALRISNNELKNLPVFPACLTNLRVLDAQNNSIRAVEDATLQSLGSLRHLNVYNNGLEYLPSAVQHLCNLTVLNLEFNNLQQLPDELGQLPLVVLNVAYNLLQELPVAIVESAALQVLTADGNPLNRPPLQCARLGIEQMRRYFRGIRPEAESASVRAAKVVVVGQPKSGKTSVVRSLIATSDLDDYVTLPLSRSSSRATMQSECSTPGSVAPEDCDVNIQYWVVHDGDPPLEVAVWDFDEGEEAQWVASAPLIFSESALFLLAWDVRRATLEQFDHEVQFWIDAVQTRVPGAVIQIVATNVAEFSTEELEERCTALRQRLAVHEDWRLASLNRRLQRLDGWGHQHFPEESRRDLQQTTILRDQRPQVQVRILPVSISSCAPDDPENTGVQAMRSEVRRLLTNQSLFPQFGTVVPAAWLAVFNILRARRQEHPYMLWDEFLKLCSEAHVPEVEVRDALLFWNTVGEAVYFVEDGLADVVVLDPSWPLGLVRRVFRNNLADELEKFVCKAGETPQVQHAQAAVEEFMNLGILSMPLLRYVLWKDLRLPDFAYAYCVQLMSKFDVVHGLTAEQGVTRYLVPGVLRRCEGRLQWPALADEVFMGRRVRFHRFMPPGLLGRLIARTHALVQHHAPAQHPPNLYAENRAVIHTQAGVIVLDLWRASDSTERVHVMDLRAMGEHGCEEALASMLDHFMTHADMVIAEYPGVLVHRSILCPQCMANGTSDDKHAEINVQHVLQASRNHILHCKAPQSHLLRRFQLMPDLGSSIDPHRATFAVGVYDPARRRLVSMGSCCLVDARRGLLLTAAHNFRDPRVQNPTGLFMGIPHAVLVIGQFVSARERPSWRYVAEIVVDPNKPHTPFLDAGVLRIVGTLAQAYDGYDTIPVDIVRDFIPVVTLPLPALPELPLGDSRTVQMKDTLTLLGYPMFSAEEGVPHSVGGICQASGPVLQFCNGFIKVDVHQHSGSSGGPALNRRGHVVGVLSKGCHNVAHLVPEQLLRPLFREAVAAIG